MSLDFLGTMAPLGVDLLLAIGAGLLLIADLVLPPGDKRSLAWMAGGVLFAALVGTFVFELSGPALGGVYVSDGLVLFFKRVFLVSAILAVLGSYSYVAERFTRRQGEYYLLLLLSVLGMTLLAGARDLILLVVCFELMGIPLYVLAAYDRKSPAAVEGALKLFLTGAVSSVTLLFGLSLLFGLASTTNIADVAVHVSAHPSPAALLGAALALAGMGFKLGVFPFHMWVPDTYESAGAPFVAFLSVAPKAAGIAALVQLLHASGQVLLNVVLVVLLVLATLTLLFGNFLALNQDNVKRLLGYSGVAHIGFVLMALASGTELGLASLLFYVAGYVFTNVGVFLVLHALEKGGGGDDTVTSFQGLGRRSGWLALAMLVFLLSLAGIPFVVGFWAKMFVFVAAWAAGLEWLVILGAVLSVLALFYYLRIVRAMYMTDAEQNEPISVDLGTRLGILICLAFVVLMGLMPRPFVDAAVAAAAQFTLGMV